MATFAQIYAVSKVNDNIARVEVAIVKAAIAISSEAINTVNHINRVMLCQRVLHDPDRWSNLMAIGVATNDTVQTSPTDQNIYDAVFAMWNAYAGVAE